MFCAAVATSSVTIGWTMSKAAGHKSRKFRRMVSERACLVCGFSPCDPHHFPLRRSHGGADTLDNMVPLCHKHHRAFHDGDETVKAALQRAAPLYFGLLDASR